MNTLKNIIGLIITSAILVGVIFKLLDLSGSGNILVISISSLSIYILLVADLIKLKHEKFSFTNFKNRILGYSGAVLSVGLLFKIMHWPGSYPMLYVGSASLLLGGILYLIEIIRSKKEFNLSPEIIYITLSFAFILIAVALTSN